MTEHDDPRMGAKPPEEFDLDGALERTRRRLGQRRTRRRIGAAGATAVLVAIAIVVAVPQFSRDDSARVSIGGNPETTEDRANGDPGTSQCSAEEPPWGGRAVSLPTFFAGGDRQWLVVSDGVTVLFGDDMAEYAERQGLLSPQVDIALGDERFEPWALVDLGDQEQPGRNGGNQVTSWFLPASVALEIERLDGSDDHQVLIDPGAFPPAAASIDPDDRVTMLGTCVDAYYREALTALTAAPGLPPLSEGSVVRAMTRLDSIDLAEPLLVHATEWAAAEGVSFANDEGGWLLTSPSAVRVGERVSFVAGAHGILQDQDAGNLFVFAEVDGCEHYLGVAELEVTVDPLTTITRGAFTVTDGSGACRQSDAPAPEPVGRFLISRGCVPCFAGSVEILAPLD